MFVKRVMSWSKMLTEVRPVGTSHCVLVESSSTCAVKYPPWHRSFDPSFMFSSTTWLAPNGIHSPIRIVTLLMVITSSRSSRIVLSLDALSDARCALEDITGPPTRRSDRGRYGDTTYDTSSASVMVDSRVNVVVRSRNLESSHTTWSNFPSIRHRSSTSCLSSSGSRLPISCSPLGEIWYAVTLWCSFVDKRRPFTSLPSTRSSRSSFPSCVTFRYTRAVSTTSDAGA